MAVIEGETVGLLEQINIASDGESSMSSSLTISGYASADTVSSSVDDLHQLRQQTPAAVVPVPLEVSVIRGSIVNLQKELPEIRFRREKARKTLADLKFKLIEAKMNGNETDKKISSIVAKVDATRKVIAEHEADYVEKKNVLKELSDVLKRMNGANGQQQEGTSLLEDDDLNSSGSHKSLSSFNSVASLVENALQQKNEEIRQKDATIRQLNETIQQLHNDGEMRRSQAETNGENGDNSTAIDHSGGGGEDEQNGGTNSAEESLLSNDEAEKLFGPLINDSQERGSILGFIRAMIEHPAKTLGEAIDCVWTFIKNHWKELSVVGIIIICVVMWWKWPVLGPILLGKIVVPAKALVMHFWGVIATFLKNNQSTLLQILAGGLAAVGLTASLWELYHFLFPSDSVSSKIKDA